MYRRKEEQQPHQQRHENDDDDHSSSSDSSAESDGDAEQHSHSTTTTTTNAGSSMNKKGCKGGGCDEEGNKIEVAQRETVAVFRLRLLVSFVLLLASIIICMIVYHITNRAIEKEYESQYEAAFKKIRTAFLDIAESKFASLSSLSVAVIAHAVDHNASWPFVTLSNFQQRASTARSQSGALDIQLSRLVTEDQRAEWENYTQVENGWMYVYYVCVILVVCVCVILLHALISLKMTAFFKYLSLTLCTISFTFLFLFFSFSSIFL